MGHCVLDNLIEKIYQHEQIRQESHG